MATLDRWRHLLQIPLTIRFPKLYLQRFDFSPPLVEGSGEIRVQSPSRFEFVLIGTPSDPEYLRMQLQEQRENPYETFSRCRLFGTDDSGTEWALGWTIPRVIKENTGWLFDGELEGLCPYGQTQEGDPGENTELLFAIPFAHPIIGLMHNDWNAGASDGLYNYNRRILDSVVHVTYDLQRQLLSMTATHSAQLPPTYAENWLSEPLRIIAGQLVYPRLVARNIAKDNVHITLRRSHELTRETSWAGLIRGQPIPPDRAGFWERYEQLLTHIALARDAKGHPNFEANTITRIYEELIQATAGSRWVCALTLASSIEALTKQLGTVGARRPDFEEEVAESFIRHLRSFPNADRLKSIAANAVGRAGKTSAVDALRALVASDSITQAQYNAWNEIRNSVMHGSLTSPYSTQKEDQKLLSLVEMLHALTIKLLEQSATAHN